MSRGYCNSVHRVEVAGEGDGQPRETVSETLACWAALFAAGRRQGLRPRSQATKGLSRPRLLDVLEANQRHLPEAESNFSRAKVDLVDPLRFAAAVGGHSAAAARVSIPPYSACVGGQGA
jgi:hypothetical protein